MALLHLFRVAGADGPSDTTDAPVFTSTSSHSTLDNLLETGYRAAATDKDGDAITYNITGGVDPYDVMINPNSGAVSFVQLPDFENPHDDNVYELTISATDNKVTTQKMMKNHYYS